MTEGCWKVGGRLMEEGWKEVKEMLATYGEAEVMESCGKEAGKEKVCGEHLLCGNCLRYSQLLSPFENSTSLSWLQVPCALAPLSTQQLEATTKTRGSALSSLIRGLRQLSPRQHGSED